MGYGVAKSPGVAWGCKELDTTEWQHSTCLLLINAKVKKKKRQWISMRQAPRYPLLQHITYFCLYFSDSFICNFLLDYFMTFSVSSLSMSLYTLFLCLSIIYFIHFITCLPFFTVIMYSEKWDFFLNLLFFICWVSCYQRISQIRLVFTFMAFSWILN